MTRTLLLAAAALGLALGQASAQTMPERFMQVDWCLDNTPIFRGDRPIEKRPGDSETYRPMAGCKSLVLKSAAVIWNIEGRQARCAIASIETAIDRLWIKGACHATNGTAYLLDIRLLDVDDSVGGNR
jgi:hypothetical protein